MVLNGASCSLPAWSGQDWTVMPHYQGVGSTVQHLLGQALMMEHPWQRAFLIGGSTYGFKQMKVNNNM